LRFNLSFELPFELPFPYEIFNLVEKIEKIACGAAHLIQHVVVEKVKIVPVTLKGVIRGCSPPL
jgi:hypothetical protein